MIRYEVTLECAEYTADALELWMRNTHIPDILATGCFRRIHFDRNDGRFRTVYGASDDAALNRYLVDHAPRMRSEFQRMFPTGVAVSRETWQEIQRWEST